jgi:hypothetical protein
MDAKVALERAMVSDLLVARKADAVPGVKATFPSIEMGGQFCSAN